MKFNIEKLLEFLDSPDTQADGSIDVRNGNRGHATSIIGLIGEDLNAAVFKHYTNNKAEILPENVVQGFKKGKWLDRWIADHDKKVLYQCEIKNWAGASLGGRTLPVHTTIEEQQDVATYNYARLINDFSIDKDHPSNLSKVLLPMRVPERFVSYTVRPMLVLWMLITDDLKTMHPHFTISNLPITDTFSEMDIFSVSLYLRQLLANGVTSVELDTPGVEKRLSIINNFLSY